MKISKNASFISANDFLWTASGCLKNSKISLVISHATSNKLTLTNDYLGISDLSALPQNSLSYAELIIYSGCEAGKGGKNADNIVTKTHEKGAKVVIGFETDVDAEEFYHWSEKFFESLNDGNTIIESHNIALAYTKTILNLDNVTVSQIVICGDETYAFID